MTKNVSALNMPGFVRQHAGQLVLAVGGGNGADVDEHAVAVGDECVQFTVVDNINLPRAESYAGGVEYRPQRLMQKYLGFFVRNQGNGPCRFAI